MDTHSRTLAKAATWQTAGLIMMAGLGYLFTGSFVQGGALALTSCILSLGSYILHERLWAQVGWGRQSPAAHAPLPHDGRHTDRIQMADGSHPPQA